MKDDVEIVLDAYINAEKSMLETIDELDGSDGAGSIKWKLKNQHRDRIKLLVNIKKDLGYE